MNQSPTAPPRRVYAVHELSQLLRGLLEDSLPRVWVEGELSNLRSPSGHWYFSLKDEQSQLRCAMFRGNNIHVRPRPNDGDQVLIRGRVTLYEPRGDLQLIVEHMEPAGEGALRRAFDELKAKLAAEGLFDESAKRALPELPTAIGLITSATGAALQDMLSTLERRYRLAPVYLLPVPVQGEAAAPAISEALRLLPERAPVDVIILARGGGSLEDLWAFNEEIVARAIRDCQVPVISGIGHEIDYTIADFAADLRAPTPTGAAERVAPDQNRLLDQLQEQVQKLSGGVRRSIATTRQHQESLAARLSRQSPQRKAQSDMQRLDDSTLRLQRALQQRITTSATKLGHLQRSLLGHHPQHKIGLTRQALDAAGDRIKRAATRKLRDQGLQLGSLQTQLRNLSPLATLARGYAVVRNAQGQPLRNASESAVGDELRVQLSQGELAATVTAKHQP